MGKPKGSTGGRLCKINTEEEYNDVVNFLLKQWEPQGGKWNAISRRCFLKKAKHFKVQFHTKANGGMIDGPVLYFADYGENPMVDGEGNPIERSLKLYVPPWRKNEIIAKFHCANGGGHWGIAKTYKLVRSQHQNIYCESRLKKHTMESLRRMSLASSLNVKPAW